MSGDIETFCRELDELVRTLPAKEVVEKQRTIALEALRRIVAKTPVDTGRAKGNWQTSISAPASGEELLDDPVASGRSVLASLPEYECVYLTNNVPYISYLEDGGAERKGLIGPRRVSPSTLEGELRFDKNHPDGYALSTADGHSVQAPHGMVAVTLEEMKTAFP